MSERTKAAKSAEQLLSSYNEMRAPINVERIAIGEGAEVVRETLEPDVSGLLLRTPTRTVLGVNESHHQRRQRFTIAHEVGHLVLHPGREYTVDSAIRLNWRRDLPALASHREEREANQFAATLLMPFELVEQAIRAMGRNGRFGDEKAAAVLAKQFDVSAESMHYRLVNLGFAS